MDVDEFVSVELPVEVPTEVLVGTPVVDVSAELVEELALLSEINTSVPGEGDGRQPTRTKLETVLI